MSGGTPKGYIVTGTDTDVGKTVFAAALVAALDGAYWKPIQAGLHGETDAATVRRLSSLPAERILQGVHTLQMAASPHIAARHENVEIRQRDLALPSSSRALVVEGAGGLMVPLSSRLLQVDLFAHWGLPVVVCARTSLGTINHTLLSLEALRRRRVPVHGVVFIGAAEREVEETIATLGRVRRLGRLPLLAPLDAGTLTVAFGGAFDLRDFVG